MKLIILFILTIFFTACSVTPPKPEPDRLIVAVSGERTMVGLLEPQGWNGEFELLLLGKPEVICKGQYKFRRNSVGRGIIKCSDEYLANLAIKAEGHYQGSAKGKSSSGPIKLVYGYSLEKTNRRLKYPNNQTLARTNNGSGLILVEKK